MSPAPATGRPALPGAPRGRLRTLTVGVLRAPVARRTWAETLYLIASTPLAAFGFAVCLVTLVLGVALSVTFVGLPLLALGGRIARGFGAVDRGLARMLLDEWVPAPPRAEPGPGVLGWLRSALRDGGSWRARAYLLIRLPLALVSVYLTLGFWGEGLFCLSYPIWWQATGPAPPGPGNSLLDLGALILRGGSRPDPALAHGVTLRLNGHLYLDAYWEVLLVALAGLVALLAAPWVVRALVSLDRRLIRDLLGPAPGSRVRQLEAARAQVVDESATRLRRIERDLHDGTQAQLATLAMTLGQAKEKLQHRADVEFDPTGALELIEGAHRHAKEALVELRDIARGIHPPALDVGLDAALATLVARSAVPAVLHTDIPDRPARAIETIAYFSAAELLANAAKHSRAGSVRVEVTTRGGTLRLRVRDDGVGGARPGGGSGLTGLMDRVRAVDGELSVSSPPGGPTVVDVRLPLRP